MVVAGGRCLSASAVVLLAGGVPQPPRATLPHSALPLQLTGLMLDTDAPTRSACLVRCTRSPARHGTLVAGNRACDVAEILEVRQDADEVTRGLPEVSVGRYLANLSELLESALATPRYRDEVNGQRVIDGFEIGQVKAGGAADQLGLRNGDVIQEVNGQLLDGMATVMRLFEQIQTRPRVKVAVLRNGQKLTFVLNTK